MSTHVLELDKTSRYFVEEYIFVKEVQKCILYTMHVDRIHGNPENSILAQKLSTIQKELDKIIPIVFEIDGIHEFLDELFLCIQKAQKEFIERKQYEYWKTLPLE